MDKQNEEIAHKAQSEGKDEHKEEPVLVEENKQTEPVPAKVVSEDKEKKVEEKKVEVKKVEEKKIEEKKTEEKKDTHVKAEDKKLLEVDTKKAKKEQQLEEREDFDYEEAHKSWSEYRVTGKAPTRRGYHASFIHGNYLYVHGGHDIREGTIDAMYKIDLNPKGNENEWELITQRGVEKPGHIAYHTLTCCGDKAYLFGGSDLGKDNKKMYEFDVNTNDWKVVRPVSTENPLTRDEHAAELWNDIIVIFGGNVRGFKSNDVWFYHIKENRWEEIKIDACPPERSNHAYAI